MELSHGHVSGDSQRLLGTGIILTLVIFLIEFFGGVWSRSLALMSDAWHIFIDIWALALSFLAVLLAKRPVDERRTFGLHRMEVFAAVINGLTVFLIAIGILYAAWKRYRNPVPVHAGPLLGVAGLSLILNVIVAGLFYKRSREDLNLRGAFIHIVGDALNTVAVIIAGVLILATGSNLIDPIVSVLIAGGVLWGSGRLLWESANTLLEGVPHGLSLNRVEEEIRRVQGVLSVHDLHVWSICSHLNALSGHVLLEPDNMPDQHTVLKRISDALKERFGIIHTTIQVESAAWHHSERRMLS